MKILIVTVVLLLLLSLILYSLYKDYFRLHWIKFFYGKYSYQFTRFYKDLTCYNPYTQGITDDPQNHYRSFFNDKNSSNNYNIDNEIKFSKMDFYIQEKFFLRKMSEPNTFNAEKLNYNNLHIFGYNDVFFGKKLNTNYYFLDKKLFMGEFVFVDIGIENINSISSTLQKKYFGNEVEIEKNDYMIFGSNETKIHFEYNGFDLSIRYFSGKDTNSREILSNSLDFESDKCFIEDKLELELIL